MRLVVLAAFAKLLRIQFKVDGRPFGTFTATSPGDSASTNR